MSEHPATSITPAEELRDLRWHLARLEAEARELQGGPGQGGVVSSIAYVEGKIAALEKALRPRIGTPIIHHWIDPHGDGTPTQSPAIVLDPLDGETIHAKACVYDRGTQDYTWTTYLSLPHGRPAAETLNMAWWEWPEGTP